MDPRREGENEAPNQMMQDEMTTRGSAPRLGGGAGAAAPRQTGGLSTLEEEEFINTVLPLPPKLEEEAHGAFHWVVDDWMALPDRAVSKTFRVAGHEWSILVFPRGNQAAETASLYIEYSPQESQRDGAWHACALFCLAMSNVDNPELFKHNQSNHRFVADESDWGFPRFAELRHIMAPVDEDTGPLMDNGRVRLSAYVRVIKDPLGVLWHNFQNYDSRQHTGFVGLRNQGATCYMNSLLQSLYFTNEFRNAVYQIPTENDDPQSSVALALQRVFYNLQVSGDAVDTTELTKSFGWDSIESFMQHDVQEFNRVLQDNLETKMKGTVVDGAVARLFEGKMKSYIRCVNVEYESSRVENYYDISLNVKGCATLRDSFANYCEVEMLDGENKYQAEGLGLQDARKGVIFESFPPVLQLQLKRFEYDFEQDAMVKINDRHEFPPTIDLQEFLSEDADRSEPWTYALHGVLVHSGDLHSGHYFGLLRPTAAEAWYRFDDDRVIPVLGSEVFEEYYGGEFQQQQTQAQAQAQAQALMQQTQGPPGQQQQQQQQQQQMHMQGPPVPPPRPNSKRFTNAYMLVYIREARRDRVLCQGAAPVPEHLLRRIQEEREAEERRAREKQELANTLMVKVVGHDQFARHQGFDLCYFDQRQPADNPLFAERMPRTMTVAEFAAHYAQRTGLAPGSFRLWTMVGRVNKTVRCDHPLVGDALALTLAQTMEGRSTRWAELRLFCEQRTPAMPDGLLAAAPPPEEGLVHVKLYDPDRQLIGGIGGVYVHREQPIAAIVPAVRAMAQLPPDAPLAIYEEVKPGLIEELDPALTFAKAEIQSGDIVCVQVAPGPGDTRPLAHVPDYFEDIQNRVSVRFVQLPARGDAGDASPAPAPAAAAAGAAAAEGDSPLVLTASTKTEYDRVACWVAEQIGVRDPLKLRFYTVSPSGQPRHAVRRTPTTTLGEMLPSSLFIQPAVNAAGLAEYTVMYERLEVNIVQIESMRPVRVTYVGRTMREETPVEVLVPKVGVAQALIEAAYAKVEQALRAQLRDAEDQQVRPFSLQFYAVGGGRIARLLAPDDRLSDLGSPGVTDVVAQRYGDDAPPATQAQTQAMDAAAQMTDADADADAAAAAAPGATRHQVEVFHYHRDLAHAHSAPFLFEVFPGEPWPETWARLQRKLGLSDKELRNMGVVCGPAGVHDLRQCRTLIPGPPSSSAAAAATADSGAAAGDYGTATPPPPAPPALSAAAADGNAPALSRAASMQSSDGAPAEPADGVVCLWDVLRQMAAAADAPRPALLGGLAGAIGLNHIDRSARHRNQHHERAIRIRN
ncbi:ubiquitin-specific protease ubp15 [Coemansia javaensis]|uniref:ubiquitinyl hydrolase 1 n=1 Tax=Coemansia javaensis TaxID=2761396 RepID=A0A9W8LGM8_9FUNG|nr:ubiquitin-specific protease ubp15 [Coemansia javaensis]